MNHLTEVLDLFEKFNPRYFVKKIMFKNKNRIVFLLVIMLCWLFSVYFICFIHPLTTFYVVLSVVFLASIFLWERIMYKFQKEDYKQWYKDFPDRMGLWRKYYIDLRIMKINEYLNKKGLEKKIFIEQAIKECDIYQDYDVFTKNQIFTHWITALYFVAILGVFIGVSTEFFCTFVTTAEDYFIFIYFFVNVLFVTYVFFSLIYSIETKRQKIEKVRFILLLIRDSVEQKR